MVRIDLEKRYVLFGVLVLGVLVSLSYVYATWAGSGVGHDWNEIRPCADPEQVVKTDASGSWVCADYSSGSWDSVTDGISYVGGNVGIGTTGPSSKLEVAAYGSQVISGGNFVANIHGYHQDGLLVHTGYKEGKDIVRFSSVGGGFVEVPRFVVKDTGNVGIGTTTPEKRLHLVGDSMIIERSDGWAGISLRDSSGDSWSLAQAGNGGPFTIRDNFGGDSKVVLSATSSGDVGIGTTTPASTYAIPGRHLEIQDSNEAGLILHSTGGQDNIFIDFVAGSTVQGNIALIKTGNSYSLDFNTVSGNPAHFGGVVSAGSSREIKKEIRALSREEYGEILEKLKKADVVRYYYKAQDLSKEQKYHIGVIAEDSPTEIVSLDKKGIELPDYLGFLMAVSKAQQGEIEELKAEIAELRGE